MPIRLNLFHEQQKQLAQRKRDPLKIGMLVLACVALGLVLYYVYRAGVSESLRSERNRKQSEFGQRFGLSLKDADTREKTLEALNSAASALSAHVESRFYWAPLLEALVKSVPPQVQLTSFTGSNEPKDNRVNLTLEGIAAGKEPRNVAEKFRIALIDNLSKRYPGSTALFRDLVEADTLVKLDGNTLPTARFSISIVVKRPPTGGTAR